MDSLLPILCLAVGSALPLAALFLLLRRGMRQLAVANAYQEVAHRLGLSADTRGVSVQGHVDDRRLWIGEVMVGHGPDRQMVTWGVIDLERPLGLGLLLRRRGLSERLFSRSRAPEIDFGEPELGRLVEIRADEPSRVRRLLSADVRSALRDLLSRWPDVVVTDQSVRVHLRQPESSGERLQALVNAMLRLCLALEKARQQVPVPPHLEGLAEDWAPMLERFGLELEPWLPGASGEHEGRRIVLAPRREPEGYRVELRLAFQPHRESGLRVRPQVEPDGYWSVGQDIQVGDPPFDAAFVVKGWDPERIRALLGPSVRQGLVRLAASGTPELDDRGLRVRNLPLSAGDLEPIVATAIDIADGLGW